MKEKERVFKKTKTSLVKDHVSVRGLSTAVIAVEGSYSIVALRYILCHANTDYILQTDGCRFSNVVADTVVHFARSSKRSSNAD